MGLTGNFADDLSSRFGHLIRDQQCAFFGVQRAENPAEALSKIKNLHVTPVEHVQVLLDRVSSILNVPSKPIGRENQGRGSPPVPAPETLEILREILKRDCELYADLVSKKFS